MAARALPDEWFTNPGFTEPTRLHVTADGRMLGHIATWWQKHLSLMNGPLPVYPPRNPTGAYAYFLTGAIRTRSGTYVRTGGITLDGSHPRAAADTILAAAAYYDRTDSMVADLTVGEDDCGIWVSGALRPGLTPEQERRVRALQASGDWRWVPGARGGGLELIGICMTDNPQFPVRPRPYTVTAAAAAAAGTASPAAVRRARTELDGLRRRLDAVEDRRRSERVARAEQRLADLRVAAVQRRMAVLERRGAA